MLPSIIGVSGTIECGKDTFFELLMQERSKTQLFTKFAFADSVKRVVAELTGDADQWTREGKARVAPGFKQSNGLLQQIVGAGMRNTIDSEVWVRRCMARAKEFVAVPVREGYQTGAIITDVRYPGEVLAVQAMGGIVVRIERYTDGVKHIPKDDGRDLNHESETALNDFNGFDYVVRNEGTLEEYKAKILALLKTLPAST